MNHPLLYQINTRCWLRDLSARLNRSVTLDDVPDGEFRFWQKSGFTHIWLMGVWTTGDAARKIALHHPDLRRDYDAVLPGWTEADVAGSPYSIAAYTVPAALGGEAALKAFRSRLRERGLKLILDFVPNHLGIDHPWVRDQPELFVQSPGKQEGSFAVKSKSGTHWIAHGKDPYFPAWTDVAQLDYRRAATRTAMTDLLLSIAARCDGVRCDMAMLLLNDVFAQTWGPRPNSEPAPATEFWPEAIRAVKAAVPGFAFMAEVYWGLEGRLQELGFDYTYDKALYDDLMWRHHAEAQRKLLTAPPGYVARSVHFLENHDEPRVAAKLSPAENRAAALVILGLPGVRFLHEGQLTGARLKIPVQLSRRPFEPVHPEIEAAYDWLLEALSTSGVGKGDGLVLGPRAAWPGNFSHHNFILTLWSGADGTFDLAVVNLAGHHSQCYVSLPVTRLAEQDWSMKDLLGDEEYRRIGSDLARHGLYLDVAGHGAQLFHFEPLVKPQAEGAGGDPARGAG